MNTYFIQTQKEQRRWLKISARPGVTLGPDMARGWESAFLRHGSCHGFPDCSYIVVGNQDVLVCSGAIIITPETFSQWCTGHLAYGGKSRWAAALVSW